MLVPLCTCFHLAAHIHLQILEQTIRIAVTHDYISILAPIQPLEKSLKRMEFLIDLRLVFS